MTDRRLTPANGRVAHLSLKGRVAAGRFVAGDWARVGVPVADLLASPGGARDRQVLLGDRVLVLERAGGFAFLRAEKDGYCGYVAETALDADAEVTHWVSAPACHIYSAPDIKQPERARLTLGARVRVAGQSGPFAELAQGGFVPARHLARIGDWADDPAEVAGLLAGTPYLWGGNSRDGLDCSGLVQAAMLASGRDCPGDSDMQETFFPPRPEGDESFRRGDLIFWKGHVALALDATRMIHANAHHMAVAEEDIAGAIERIKAHGGGMPTSVRRP
ncbi:MAG: C40 family peptidase [Rhodobacteraceae bacterium]|nr:C40 family peptidase [Paracoccaceae bacterium]